MHESAALEQYHTIQVSTLQEGRVPPIDLYIQRESDDYPILFLSRSLPYDRRSAKNLADSEIQYLLIHEDDYSSYDRYLNQHLASIIRDPKVPIHSRCSITYDISVELMRQVYESVDPEQVMKSSQEVLQSVVDVIFSNPNASHSFITLASQDYHLYTHSMNVCLFGMALARRALDISKEEALKRFGPALLLHDIGKLDIPNEILYKSEPLTDDEYKIIKEHPAKSLEMAQNFMEVTEEMRSIFLHHHERLDGSGYPDGLKGSEVPIPARICAIVDVFDAISTNRSFQERKSSFEAFSVLKESEIPHRLDETFYRGFIKLFLPSEPSSEQ